MPYCLELYAQAFDEMDALQHFEKFAARNAPGFFGLNLPTSSETVTLVRERWSPEGTIPIAGTDDCVRPMGYRENPNQNIVLQWKMVA